MNIEPHRHVAICLQIADEVYVALAAGVYRPGEPLPPRRTPALSPGFNPNGANLNGVNPNTVQTTLDELPRRELVVRRRNLAVSANPASPVGVA